MKNLAIVVALLSNTCGAIKVVELSPETPYIHQQTPNGDWPAHTILPGSEPNLHIPSDPVDVQLSRPAEEMTVLWHVNQNDGHLDATMEIGLDEERPANGPER